MGELSNENVELVAYMLQCPRGSTEKKIGIGKLSSSDVELFASIRGFRFEELRQKSVEISKLSTVTIQSASYVIIDEKLLQ